jgi:hypothetical protein
VRFSSGHTNPKGEQKANTFNNPTKCAKIIAAKNAESTKLPRRRPQRYVYIFSISLHRSRTA